MKRIFPVITILMILVLYTGAASLDHAKNLISQGKFEAAEKELNDLINSDDSFEVQFNLAIAMMNQDGFVKFKKGFNRILSIWHEKETTFWDQKYNGTLRAPIGKTLKRSGYVFIKGVEINNPHIIRYALEFQTYFKNVLYDGHWGQWRDRCTNLHNYLTQIRNVDFSNLEIEKDKISGNKVVTTIKLDKVKLNISSESLDQPLRIAQLKMNNQDLFLLSEKRYGPVVGKLYLEYFNDNLKRVNNNAFSEGEYIVYYLNYGPVKAGFASMTLPNTLDVRGYRVYHVVSEAKTSRFFDKVYKVRNSYESFFEINSFASLKYIEDSNEYKKQRRRVTYYHPDTLQGHYEDTKFGIAHNAMDVLAALYYVRTQNLSPGKKIEVDTTSGTKNYKLIVDVYEGGEQSTKIGDFDTFLVIPRLKHESGIFKAKGELRIWMTKDSKHIPVKLSSKVAVGSFEANIIEYSNNGAGKKYERYFQ